MRRFVPWWQWLLMGTGFLLLAIAMGPVVDRSGHGTLATLILSLAALTISTVCWVLGAMRLAKWLWSKTVSLFHSQPN